MTDTDSLTKRIEELETRVKHLEEGIEVAVSFLGGDIANVRVASEEQLAGLVRLLLELHLIDLAAARRAGLPVPKAE